MRVGVKSFFGALGALCAVPAIAAGAGNFALVNQTGAAMTMIEVKRTGTSSWRPLSAGPASGARAAISFTDPDCAFDLKANFADGGSATWTGVNLCEVSAVVLNRNKSGALWVDYE